MKEKRTEVFRMRMTPTEKRKLVKISEGRLSEFMRRLYADRLKNVK